jgi:hypothetical protein
LRIYSEATSVAKMTALLDGGEQMARARDVNKENR